MRIRTKSVLYGAAAVIVSVVVTTVAVLSLIRAELIRQAEDYQNVKLRTLHELLEQKGAPRIADGKLAFGDHIVNDNYEVVDKLRKLAGGTATIFQGDLRVSTNVTKEDGSRAVGTPLVGPAKEATIDRGQPYRGQTDILGVPYFTAYDPILDNHGRTIGVLYVGVKQEEFLRAFQQLRFVSMGVAVAMAVLFGAVVSFAMGRLLQRLTALAKSADAVSLGNELDVPLVSSSQDEIGELAKAIDRLRNSMREALKRLDVG